MFQQLFQGESIQVATDELLNPPTQTPKQHQIDEQCFRCDLPDCADQSPRCLVFRETGSKPGGRR